MEKKMDAQVVKLKHDRSVAQYPEIDLRDDEYVVLAMKRSNVGVAAIWAVVGLCIVALSVILVMISKGGVLNNNLIPINAAAKHYLWMSVTLFYLVICLAGLIGQTVYTSNRLWVTNRRAIQKIRVSLFGNSTQVIELAKIEDVSFRQSGILQNIFQVGTLRMSTVGAETTYTFPMLDTPRDEVEIISGLVYEARSRKRSDKEENYEPPYYHSARAKATVASIAAEDDPIAGDIVEAVHSAPIPGEDVADRATAPVEEDVLPNEAAVEVLPAPATPDAPEFMPMPEESYDSSVNSDNYPKNGAADNEDMPAIDPSIGELAPRPTQPVARPAHRGTNNKRSRRSHKA